MRAGQSSAVAPWQRFQSRHELACARVCGMSSPALEAFLVRLYTDDDARERFFADMHGEALEAGLTEAEATAMHDIDRTGLQMAAASYARKREQHARPRIPRR